MPASRWPLAAFKAIADTLGIERGDGGGRVSFEIEGLVVRAGCVVEGLMGTGCGATDSSKSVSEAAAGACTAGFLLRAELTYA